LLLDEPDTGLSGKSLKKLVEMIEKLSESCQVLLVSHQYREYEGQKFFVEKIEVAGKSVSVVKDVDKTSYL
jgi:DNA repair ATPase RecN